MRKTGTLMSLLLTGLSLAAASDPNAAGAQTVTFDDVLKSWTSGQKEQAMKSLLAIHWNSADVFAADSIFRISEAQFAKLSEAKRAQIQQQAMQVSTDIKALARFTVEQAKQSGQQDNYRDALLNCGKRLSGEDQLALMQMIGKAVTGLVQRELGASK